MIHVENELLAHPTITTKTMYGIEFTFTRRNEKEEEETGQIKGLHELRNVCIPVIAFSVRH